MMHSPTPYFPGATLLATLLAALLWPAIGVAGELDELSIEDLMDLETDVATMVPMTPREVPGIVTVIHRDQIRRSGARDLLDLLQRVPGLHADLDVQGVLGLSVRGQWAADGRILLLLDGVPLTEPMYGASPLGGRFSLENVQRVEVIRGPGTAKYGGGASSAVINVISVASEGPDGVSVHGQGCARLTGVGCANAGGSIVLRDWNSLRVGLAVHAGDTRMSSGEYQDFWGGTFDAQKVNRAGQLLVSAAVDAGNVHVRMGGEHFSRQQQDAYDEIHHEPIRNNFDTAWASVWMDRQVGERWTLTPSVRTQFYRPWSTGDDFDVDNASFYDRKLARYEVGVGALGELGHGVQLDLGAGGLLDRIRSGPQWKDWSLPTGRREAWYGSAHARAELLWVGDHVNLVAGVRAEFQQPVGPRLVPRLAVTTSGDMVHAKVLVAGAYRSPTYEQIFPTWSDRTDAPDISAERSGTVEIEFGVRPVAGLQARANIFATGVLNPIVATTDDNDWDYYFNGDQSASAGAEGEVRYRSARADLTATYAFFTPIGKIIDTYALATRDDRVVAIPKHAATLVAAFSPKGRVWITPVARLIGPRTVFVGVDDNDDLIEADQPMAVLLDLSVRVENIADSGVSAELGAHDLLGQDPGWNQPHTGWHAPMPGRGRELRLKVSWRR